MGKPRMTWTIDKVNLLKAHRSAGLDITQIANAMGLTYDQVDGALKRYGIRDEIPYVNSKKETNSIIIKKQEIAECAKYLGEKLYENYKRINLPVPSVIKNKNKKEEHSVLDLSDVHIGTKNEVFDGTTGKKIITYNEKIFKQELAILQKSMFNIHNLLSNAYNLKHLTIFVMGDIVTNDRIFMEQVFEIEKVVGLQIWDAVEYFTVFFNNLLRIYETITIVGVPGNHGRSLPNMYSEPIENNFEYHLYRIWQKQFDNNKRIKIIVPDTRRYIHKIYNFKHMIEHGDSIKGSSETAILKQIKELYLAVNGFDIFHMGHFHTIKELEMGDQAIIKQNGSWIAQDNYAWDKFKTYSLPKQFFFGCNEHRSETWNYRIDLRG